MAKDDYPVLMAKILVYLYAKMKGKKVPPAEEYICPFSKDFPISEEYLNEVLDGMAEHEFIKLHVVRAWGGNIVAKDVDSMKITLEGIEYLRDNPTIRKVVDTIPMAATIFELFQ